MRKLGLYVYVSLCATVAACGPSGSGDLDGPTGNGADGPPRVDTNPNAPDGPTVDAGNAYGDADVIIDGGSCGSNTCANPVNDNCGATEICGDGTDNNCNGQADEGCSCQPGAVQACFLGPPGRRHVGSCVDGSQTCTGDSEFGTWGVCVGGIRPSSEQCDTQDNNCNGCADDHPDCCAVELMCPGPGDLPDGQPFQDYVIDGTAFYPGVVTTWTWTVTGGPCDRLLGNTSFTLTGQNSNRLTFHPTLSGDYTVTVTMVTPNGTFTCTFIVHIGGPGLRVELCWDTTGIFGADIDLHMHKPASTTPWFTTTLTGTTINPDDCYFINCTGADWSGGAAGLPAWGYTPSPVAVCNQTPEGFFWNLVGNCKNPRLDIDNIFSPGIPENINLDNPRNNESFRVMVHYYGGGVATHPMVNVYCGGHIRATYGAAPDLVPGFNTGGDFGAGPMWRVVDVTTQVDGNGNTTGCVLNPLHPPNMNTGYWVTNDDRSY